MMLIIVMLNKKIVKAFNKCIKMYHFFWKFSVIFVSNLR
jgi:hypothetical protein